jgi:quinol-cytochrome oxidoreductase complex cytochrome b subunit
MDHKEQHHQHHQKEREQHKKEQREHEHQMEKSNLPFHPAWLVGFGLVLILVAILVWTFLVW